MKHTTILKPAIKNNIKASIRKDLSTIDLVRAISNLVALMTTRDRAKLANILETTLEAVHRSYFGNTELINTLLNKIDRISKIRDQAFDNPITRDNTVQLLWACYASLEVKGFDDAHFQEVNIPVSEAGMTFAVTGGTITSTLWKGTQENQKGAVATGAGAESDRIYFEPIRRWAKPVSKLSKAKQKLAKGILNKLRGGGHTQMELTQPEAYASR